MVTNPFNKNTNVCVETYCEIGGVTKISFISFFGLELPCQSLKLTAGPLWLKRQIKLLNMALNSSSEEAAVAVSGSQFQSLTDRGKKKCLYVALLVRGCLYRCPPLVLLSPGVKYLAGSMSTGWFPTL